MMSSCTRMTFGYSATQHELDQPPDDRFGIVLILENNNRLFGMPQVIL